MKNHHHHGHVPPNANSRTQIHAEIAVRAYGLWELHGHPDNQADTLWLEAEQQLMSERGEPQESTQFS